MACIAARDHGIGGLHRAYRRCARERGAWLSGHHYGIAFHSMLGFAGATIGPLSFGWALDVAGGQTPTNWWVAFAHLGIISLLGPILLARSKPPAIPGDRV